MAKIFLVFFFAIPLFGEANYLAKIEGPLEEASISSYDLTRRFIWTCHKIVKPIKEEWNVSITLQNSPLCLCSPGGKVDGIGLQVSHITPLLSAGTHYLYQEIQLEHSKCQSFAAYTK